ncbi:hypothetical protein LX36DRAFT_460720 [Colletotrichum falcatum]|nr:hypothetical protein LX36DRAFT_460720 [Colletotrichum falcatum]
MEFTPPFRVHRLLCFTCIASLSYPPVSVLFVLPEGHAIGRLRTRGVSLLSDPQVVVASGSSWYYRLQQTAQCLLLLLTARCSRSS